MNVRIILRDNPRRTWHYTSVTCVEVLGGTDVRLLWRKTGEVLPIPFADVFSLVTDEDGADP